jgi:hypothetical protein
VQTWLLIWPVCVLAMEPNFPRQSVRRDVQRERRNPEASSIERLAGREMDIIASRSTTADRMQMLVE